MAIRILTGYAKQVFEAKDQELQQEIGMKTIFTCICRQWPLTSAL